MWFTSIKGGQRPNEVQSEVVVDRFASNLWLWSEFLAWKSCEVPLCSLGGTYGPEVADSAPTGVNFGCDSCFHVSWCVRGFGNMGDLNCCSCCLPGLHPTGFLILFSHFYKLCEFFFVYLFTEWLLKRLDVSAKGGAFVSLEVGYNLQLPQQRICHFTSKEKPWVYDRVSCLWIIGMHLSTRHIRDVRRDCVKSSHLNKKSYFEGSWVPLTTCRAVSARAVEPFLM